MKVYTFGDKTVKVDSRGIVESSNSESFPVGSEAPAKMMKACGWQIVKSPKVYYSHGTTSSNRFSK